MTEPGTHPDVYLYSRLTENGRICNNNKQAFIILLMYKMPHHDSMSVK